MRGRRRRAGLLALLLAAPAVGRAQQGCPDLAPLVQEARRAREELAALRPPDARSSHHDREVLRELSRGYPLHVEDASPAPGAELAASLGAAAPRDEPREDLSIEGAYGFAERVEVSAGGSAGIRDGEARGGPVEAGLMGVLLDVHGLRPAVAVSARGETGGGERSLRAALLVTEQLGLTRLHLNAAHAWREGGHRRLDGAVGADRVLSARVLALADAWGRTRSGDEPAEAGGEAGTAVLLSHRLVLQAAVGLAARAGAPVPSLRLALLGVW